MKKLLSTFEDHPFSAPLVLLAIAFAIVGAFAGSTEAYIASVSCLIGATIFKVFFE